MPITVANVVSNTTAGSTTLTLAFTGVTAGSTLAVGIAQSASSAGRTYSVADDVNGAWAPVVQITGVTCPNRHSEIFKFAGSASGNLTVTVTCNSSTSFAIGGIEIISSSGAVNDSDSVDNAGSTTLVSSAATGFSPNAGSLVFSVISPAASVGAGDTPDADYTDVLRRPVTAPQGYIAYRIVGGSPLTDEQLTWVVGTGRTHVGAIAAFSEYVAPPASAGSNFMLLGVS